MGSTRNWSLEELVKSFQGSQVEDLGRESSRRDHVDPDGDVITNKLGGKTFSDLLNGSLGGTVRETGKGEVAGSDGAGNDDDARCLLGSPALGPSLEESEERGSDKVGSKSVGFERVLPHLKGVGLEQ